MKTILMITVIALLAVIALGAQSGFSFQTPQQSLTNCPTGIAATNTFCSGPDAFYVISGTGTAVKIAPGAQGPAGPAGAQGPAGANGAIGPQGPAGSFSGPACITLTGDLKGNVIITPVTCK